MQMSNNQHAQGGQAMTEFLISASFFLIPLFLAMSLIAKYIDIKQANIQAARYQAWEYTVWFANDTERGIDYSSGKLNNGGEVMSGFNAVNFPVKTTTKTRNESKQRFYEHPGNEQTTTAITSTDGTPGWSAANANRFWVDHKGSPLYSGIDGINANLTSSTDTPTLPVVGDVINILLQGIGLIFGVVGDLMSLVGSDVKFNAITTEGYANITESMRVAVPPNYRYMVGNRANLMSDGTVTIPNNYNFIASAAVLSDAWNTGGREHTYNQVGGMVPTTLLNELFNAIPGFTTIWNIVSLLAPELRLCNPGTPWPNSDKGSLWLGHIDIDAIHPDRLIADPSDPDTRIGEHEINDAGMVDFTYSDPANERSEASRSCM